jgi:hypothetical protein
MRKVVINACYGGFSLSKTAVLRARELGAEWATAQGGCALAGEQYSDGSTCSSFMDSSHPDCERHDPVLVQVVEELGEAANGAYARLKVRKVSGRYRITEYDGYEGIETPDDIAWEVTE